MEGGPLLTAWWQKAATEDVIPYLNVEARWNGAPDQGLLREKGGRGFPYCVLMDPAGEVVWEVRPQTEAAWRAALADAARLVELRAAAAQAPDDEALAASVVLLEAMGRSQRPTPPLEELDAHAEVEGVAAELLARFGKWRRTQMFSQAARALGQERGKAAFALFVAGERPDDQSEGLRFSFYQAALEGAIGRGDRERATELLALWRASSSDPKYADWLARRAAEYEKRIRELDQKR